MRESIRKILPICCQSHSLATEPRVPGRLVAVHLESDATRHIRASDAGGPKSTARHPENVLIEERSGDVLIVTMNRPAQRNALNAQLRVALRTSFDAFEADRELRCAVLTGNGPLFCAGADLKEMAATSIQLPSEDYFAVLGSRGGLSKPVIAAVNGDALGAGFFLAQECDLCIAVDTAQFGIPEVKRGRGSPWAAGLISMLPKRLMMQLLLTGDAISASRSYDVGLVNAVVSSDDLLGTALEMAHTIADNAPLSVWAAKRTVVAASEMTQSDALQAAHRVYERVYLSEDAREGPRAFAEKRNPQWKGR